MTGLALRERFQALSVRSRLVLAMSAIGLLVLLLAGLAFWHFSRILIEEFTRDQLDTVERVVRKDLVAALLEDSVENVARVNRLFASFPEVIEAQVLDARGKVRFGYRRDGAGGPAWRRFPLATERGVRVEGDHAVAWRRLAYDGKLFGHLVLRFSLERQQAYFARFRSMLLLLLPVLFLLSLVVALRMQRRFSAPIEELAATFREVRQKEDYSLRLRTSEKNEIAALYEGFNAMLGMVSQSQDALAETGSRLQAILSSIRDSILVTDLDCRVVYVNPATPRLLGRNEEELLGKRVQELLHLSDATGGSRDPKVLEGLCHSGQPLAGEEILFLNTTLGERPVSISTAPIEQQGRETGIVVVIRDMHECWHLARELSWQARHDSLTGLINRAEFERRLDEALESVRPSSPHVLLYLDLDQFKVVNDTCGHLAGDELLRQLSSILAENLRDEDLFARLGGDEFAVLLHACPLRTAWEIAERLRTVVSDFRFVWERHTFDLAVSIGMVVIDDPEMTRTDVLLAADMACYAAKDAGRNRIHLYRSDKEEHQRRYGDVQWVSRIVQALDENRFELYYQKIVPVDSPRSEQALHFEVLLRMRDEQGALVLPGSFLPAAERFGSAPAVDRWVLENALERLADWPGERLGMCAINLSGHTLSDRKFLDFVRACIRDSGVPPDRICFEITETVAVSDLVGARHFIGACRAMGCRFALDDFGSGVSSFGYLKNLPVDYLKIDGMFVREIERDPIDEAMVHAINEIGHVMGMQTIAEFVESRAAMARLRTLDVDWMQGHVIHRPEPLTVMSASPPRRSSEAPRRGKRSSR